jgi:NADPH-dependent 2,4-dienoyl-CoA reductase/sulfur reductase-like enzyme
MRPRLYEAQAERLQVALLPLLERVGADFVRGGGGRLDDGARRLIIGDEQEIPYARLVVATGSRMRRSPIPGAEEAFASDMVRPPLGRDARWQGRRREVRALDAPGLPVRRAGAHFRRPHCQPVRLDGIPLAKSVDAL